MSDKKYTSIKHENAPGRVEFQGGKAVWHWAQDQNDSTSILLKSLENPDLALEATQKTPVPRATDSKLKAEHKPETEPKPARSTVEPAGEETVRLIRSGRAGGFDPYNRG